MAPGSSALGQALYSADPQGILIGLLRIPWDGLPYAGTLLVFFLAHEMGHYVACRLYGVACTLPYFIPSPPYLLFGTFGAVIRIRGTIPHRRALFDIGIAGPLAGFAVAVPVLAWGLLRSRVADPTPPGAVGAYAIYGDSLLTFGLTEMLRPDAAGQQLLADPVFVAGWLGLLATAMNLIPAGQFDGGHIIYALTPRWHRVVSLSSAMFLIALVATIALRLGEPSAWSAWAIVVFVLGRHHPPLPNEQPGLGFTRIVLAILALGILALCFMPSPIRVVQF
ncbi:MAG: site-2 protease family protein [Acidobacteriota bacterium]|nr:MAG: site-2 protease family protein [Acidobacteriota bacterium]